MKFDPSKPVETRDGREARVICTDMNGEANYIVALVRDRSGFEVARTFSSSGAYRGAPNLPAYDLINIPEKGYINIWWVYGKLECSNPLHKTAKEAEETAGIYSESRYAHIALEVELPND